MNFDPTLYVVGLVKALAFATALAVIFRVRVRPALVWAIAGAVIALLLGYLWLILRAPEFGYDYRIFCKVGRDVWLGFDPYAPNRFEAHPFLNPPTALPLFAFFSWIDASVGEPQRHLPLGLAVWTVANVVGCMALIRWSQRALLHQEAMGRTAAEQRTPAWLLSPTAIAALTACLMVSDAAVANFHNGQLSILVAVMLVAALAAQAHGLRVWAGIGLGLATIKVPTMLPFLLLFLRKRDWLTWLVLVLVVLGLCLASAGPSQLPVHLGHLLERIKELTAPGQVNDYSFDGPISDSILGFDQAFYRLGLRDRHVITFLQYGTVLALTLGIGTLIVGNRLPRAAACSLVALFATVFLYHRRYDAVILVLPLAYCAGQARSATGRSRWVFTICAVSILLVLYLNFDWLHILREKSMEWGAWGRLTQAILLPYATWLVVISMVCLVIGSRANQTDATIVAAASPQLTKGEISSTAKP